MKIKQAEFICSATKPRTFPPSNLPEIVFAGRSNVGKSSLINTLLNRKGLAKTSSVPGKTRTINFYLINTSFYMVDVPGYGFAKVSKGERGSWKDMVENYFLSGRDIRGIVQLVDIRRGIEDEEEMIIEWMDQLDIPVTIVLTKADKLSGNKKRNRIRLIRSSFDNKENPVCFSSMTREGKTEIWKIIENRLQT